MNMIERVRLVQQANGGTSTVPTSQPMEMPAPKATAATTKPHVVSCVKCNGSGVWNQDRSQGPWARACFRCNGQGYITAEVQERNARYDQVKGTADQRVTHAMFNNQIVL